MGSSIVIDPFSRGSNDGTLNGTTEVTIVPAPAASISRLVKIMIVHNRNAIKVKLTIAVKNGTDNRYVFDAEIDPGDSFEFGDSDEIFLDSTSKSVVAFLDIIPATQPDFSASWSDI